MPSVSVQVAVGAGYFSDLAVARLPSVLLQGRVVWQFAVFGGHSISGPPSEAGTFWTVAARNVPTTPTIRTAVLIVRFMGSSPDPRAQFPREEPWRRVPHYRARVKQQEQCFSLSRFLPDFRVP